MNRAAKIVGLLASVTPACAIAPATDAGCVRGSEVSSCESLGGPSDPARDVASSRDGAISASATFAEGLRADLASIIAAEKLDPYQSTVLDGVGVYAGYGTDIVQLRVPFHTGPFWGRAELAPPIETLSIHFGGLRSGFGQAAAVRAADELWEALRAAPIEMVDGRATRRTPGKRAECYRVEASDERYCGCVLIGFQSVMVR
jgi:hypothetical protein